MSSTTIAASVENRLSYGGLFLFLVILVTGFCALLQLSRWPSRLRYPGEEDYIEGTPLVEMLHVRQGFPIYEPPSSLRFGAANYGPLYYLVGSRLLNPERPAYLPLRVLSVLGTAGCVLAGVLLAFWLTNSYWAATLAASLILASGYVARYGISVRSDSLALAVAFSGFLVAYRFKESRRILFAVPLLALGLFYKQQFVAAPLAVWLFLLVEKRFRTAAEFATLMVAGGAGLIAFFHFVVFPGQHFLSHLILYNNLPFDRSIFFGGIVLFVASFSAPLVASLLFLRRHPNKLVSCYLGMTVFLALLLSGRVGISTNYFLECVILMGVLFAAEIASSRMTKIGVAAWSIVLGGTLVFNSRLKVPDPRLEDFGRDQAIQDFLRTNFSTATPAIGYFVGDLVRAGLDVPNSNFWHYTQLVRKGTISEQGLLGQLDTRHFGVILLDFDLRSDRDDLSSNFYLDAPLRSAILRNYHLAAKLSLPSPENDGMNDAAYFWIPLSSQILHDRQIR